MIKSLLLYTSVFVGVFLIAFGLHEGYLENNQIEVPFSLKKVYLFHLGFSLLICINFKLFSVVNKIFVQLGFIYLVTIVLKFVLFGVIFYQSIFNQENLIQEARISLLIPTILFLLTEAFFVVKILNKNNS